MAAVAAASASASAATSSASAESRNEPDLAAAAPIYSEHGRALRKRMELRRKLEERRRREAEERGEVVEKEMSQEEKMSAAQVAAETAKAIEDAQRAAAEPQKPRERVKIGGKSMLTTEVEMSASDQARIQAKCAAGKAGKIKAVARVESVSTTFDESNLDADAVLVFSHCTGSEFVVSSHCTKIFVEQCRQCTFRFSGKIITAVVEVDNCEECNIFFATKVGTLQIEQCRRMNVVYAEKQHMSGYIVWAGCFMLRVQVGSDLMRCDFGLTAKVDKTVNVERTQFKIHYNTMGKLVCDKIIRLANGFPTTRLEDEEYKRRREAKLLELGKRMGITVHRKESNIGGRVKPNEPCPCGSGKKYKKCCRA